jgi:outer membrane biosynthesis protein TonB
MRKWLLLPIAASLMAGACASASAKGKAKDAPALNMPAPPPRMIEPSPEPAPPEPVNDLPAVAPMPPPAPSPRASRPAPRPQAEKPAEKPVETVTDPPPVPVPQPPAQPPAQLRTPQTADANYASRAVQATIDRANSLLAGINYGLLSDERKKAYDDAKRFMVEAGAAIKQGNLVFAQGVATKAETLARELAGK